MQSKFSGSYCNLKKFRGYFVINKRKPKRQRFVKSHSHGLKRRPPPRRLLGVLAMEGLVKKYQRRFRKVREIMDEWEKLQSRLISQFSNASAIIESLKVIQDCNNYGSLKSVDGVIHAVVRKQMEALQTILLSLNKTLEEFRGLVLSMERMYRDGRQLVKGGGGSNQLNAKQLRQRVGIKPCLADCLDGLMILHDMHQAEYLLKSSIVSALSALTLKPSSSDLGALQQLLVDQPNIPKEEACTWRHRSLYLPNHLTCHLSKHGWKLSNPSSQRKPLPDLCSHVSNQRLLATRERQTQDFRPACAHCLSYSAKDGRRRQRANANNSLASNFLALEIHYLRDKLMSD